MAQPLTSSNIEALIEGGVSGQVAVGNQNVQIHADHGAVVFLTPPGTQPTPKLRSLPILQRPRPARGLLDRQADISSALTAIGTSLPVGVYGAPGIGKSTLLRHLAYAVETGALPDGVIHLPARQQPAEDLLQSLFDAFYACDVPLKPTAVQARQLLRGRKALVLLDDSELGREAAEELLDSAPDCAFVLAMRERCLWGECKAIGLGGLPPEDARALFERELGRSLTAEEAPAFESLYARLNGHPLHLLQAAAEAREGRPIAEPALIDEGSGRQALAAISEDQRCVLSALAAVGGGPVDATHLSALAGVANSGPALDALLERKLVQSHSPRYSLTGNLPDLLPQALDLTPWRERALAYFVDWAESRQNEPAALLEEAGVLRRLLDWAAETGRHNEARRLGRALDTALTVTGRWGAWEQSLERVRGAAEALGDRATQGWALHQLGTRLLCLDDKSAARRLLNEALAIREALGDRAGAAVTRHNLGLLGALPPSEQSGGKGPRSALRLLPWVGGALLVLVVGGIGLRSFWSGKQDGKVDTTVPLISETPHYETETHLLSTDETSDLTTEATETTPIATTDLPPDERIGFAVPKRLEFPVMVLATPPQSRVETISVTNTGTIPLRVAGVSFSENPDQAFSLTSGCEHSLLPAGPPCSIQVAFHPPKTGSYHAVLAIDAEGLKRQLVEISGAATEPEPTGWCCADGRITSASQTDCENRRGGFFENRVQATRACRPPGGCCVNGGFKPGGTPEQCAAVKGTFMPLGEASRCQPPPPGWCCVDGNVFSASQDECKGRQGTFSYDRKRISSACRPPGGCCVNGDFKPGGTPEQCTAVKGTFMLLSEASRCQPLGWCCAKREVFSASQTDCNEQRGKFFEDQKQASIACQPPGGCCIDGDFREGETREQCAEDKGTYMLLSEASRCQPQGWCCAGGKVLQGTEAECVERKGTFSEKKSGAQLACAATKTGCCLNGTFEGGVVAEECKRREGVAMTAVEALFRCRKPQEPKPNEPQKGWCCLQGDVIELTAADCERRRGTFFETREKALQSCPSVIR